MVDRLRSAYSYAALPLPFQIPEIVKPLATLLFHIVYNGTGIDENNLRAFGDINGLAISTILHDESVTRHRGGGLVPSVAGEEMNLMEKNRKYLSVFFLISVLTVCYSLLRPFVLLSVVNQRADMILPFTTDSWASFVSFFHLSL